MYILGCIWEGVLFENKRFAYLDSSASTSAIWIISKVYRFLAIGGVKKAPFLYQVFPKVKSIFTPGVATRLAVVTVGAHEIFTTLNEINNFIGTSLYNGHSCNFAQPH